MTAYEFNIATTNCTFRTGDPPESISPFPPAKLPYFFLTRLKLVKTVYCPETTVRFPNRRVQFFARFVFAFSAFFASSVSKVGTDKNEISFFSLRFGYHYVPARGPAVVWETGRRILSYIQLITRVFGLRVLDALGTRSGARPNRLSRRRWLARVQQCSYQRSRVCRFCFYTRLSAIKRTFEKSKLRWYYIVSTVSLQTSDSDYITIKKKQFCNYYLREM